MALKFFVIVLLTLLSRNSQALVAKDPLEQDAAFELERGEQPWLALVALPGGASCSGAIVSPTCLLSAAGCLKGGRHSHPSNGVAYAGNVKYKEPKDFDPPTQNRSVVDYVLYNENNTLEYNIMLVKIAPQWIWGSFVQPVAVIDVERLPENYTSSCFVSGLGEGTDAGSSHVARSASVWMGGCAHSPQPLDHRMCFADSGVLSPGAGDVGGPVLCDYEPQDKLYGIISEHGQSISEELPDPDKIPSRISGFQFVGFYLSWINKTAGDLLCDADVKSLRWQLKHEYGLFPETGRRKRSEVVTDPPSSSVAPAGTAADGSDGDDATGATNTTGAGAGSGAGRPCAGASALLALLLPVAVCALF